MNHQEIKRKHLAGHAANKPLYPDGTCHNCGWKVPPKALWCCGACAEDHAQEKAEYLARDGK